MSPKYSILKLLNQLILILLFMGLNASCDRKRDEAITKIKKIGTRSDAIGKATKANFLISSTGDTIPTGIPIPTNGKWINPDSVAKPKRIPLKGKPKVVPVYTNVYPTGTPKVVQIPKELRVITPGTDSVPLPKTVLAQGKVVATLHPKPIPALAPRKKDAAICNIQYMDVDHGMNSSYIWSILEDSQGNLWFGTAGGGVSRYNGHTFTHFTINEGLSHNSVRSIVEDNQGNLWFGTGGGGVSRYDGHSFTHYTTEEGLSNNWVLSILEDSQGNLWFGTSSGGVNRYDGHNFTHFTKATGLSHNLVWSILEDSQGNLWFGTGGGVSAYDGHSFTHYTMKEGLSHHLVWSILEDNQGNLWFGTGGGGVSRYDGRSFTHYTTEEGLSNNLVLSILEDSQGNLWFGTENGGVSRFDGQNFTHYTTKEGLSYNSIWSILEDSQGYLWFGTGGAGVNLYGGKSFSQCTAEEGLGHNLVLSILEDSHGDLWFGTRGGGVGRHDGFHFTYYTAEEGLSHNSIWSILEDSQGNLWFGTENGGLNRYDGQSFTNYTTIEGLSHSLVWSILEDSQGNLWFGTSGGVSSFDGHSFTHYTVKEGLSHNNVRCMLEDRQGNLWFGTRGGGLNHYDGHSFTYYTTEEGLSHNSIWSILEDSQGNLWFGTEGGVDRYDGHRFTHYTTEEGLSHNWVLSILEDKQKNIWLSTQKGITLLKPVSNKFSLISDSHSVNYQFFTFGKADGLKRLDFEPNSVCLDRNNRIWWGSADGLTTLDLNQFGMSDRPPLIRLDHVEVKGSFVDFRRLKDTIYQNTLPFGKDLNDSFDSIVPFYNYPVEMQLPHRINHLTFHFSGIGWAARHKIKYSYFLEGFDEEWSTPNPENKADYRKIPYDSYVFKVKAIGEAQAWSEPINYKFTISPPWWQTWWAYSLYFLSGMAIIWSLWRYELNRQFIKVEARRLKDLDEVKTKLYSNITHEFGTPLTIILGMADQIREKPEQWFSEGLKMITRNGRNLLQLVNQMLDLSKLEAGVMQVNYIQGDIIAYLKYLLESFQSMVESKNISLHLMQDQTYFSVSDDENNAYEIFMDYDPDKIMQIISNLLTNAIKFTPEDGEVYVFVSRQTSAVLEIRVKDTGKGIPSEKLPHIFDRFYQVDDDLTKSAKGTGIGLALTQGLVKLLNGDIKVESKETEGTEVTILLPITQKAPLSLEEKSTFPAEDVPSLPAINISLAGQSTEVENKPILLIVEDNLDVVRYLSSFLKDNYRVVAARNGRKGFDKAIEQIPDIIISDVMMPELDGLELCDKLKRDLRTSHIPIILLTAKADVASRIEGLERGADAYLAKPFNKRELFVRLEKLVALRKQLQKRYQNLEYPFPASKDTDIQIEDAFIKEVREILEAHLSEEHFNITSLCKTLGMSRTQFYRKFKALTNQSVGRYFRCLRLQKAMDLLKSSDLNVTQVAYETGFKDPAHFSRAFKETFGKKPSEFR